MGEFAEDDEEDYEGRDPGVEFVVMDDFVAEEGDEEGGGGDDDDARVAGDVLVDRVEELGAYYSKCQKHSSMLYKALKLSRTIYRSHSHLTIQCRRER